MVKDKRKQTKPKPTNARPPVVVVLGHVDHGKTTLLDYIRRTQVAEGESGGITQSIGAYRITSPTPVTFIDTPGHEAFSAMRSRGAHVADIAILVVAANDSVMPQTKESISYIKQSGIPVVVAVNKIDLPDTDPDKVKKDLLQEGIACEGFGGKTVAVNISAKSGKGVEKLLEMIGLIAQMEELTADPDGKFNAIVVESGLDPKRGNLATLIINQGTLNKKDEIIAGKQTTRIRALFDEFQNPIDQAGPGDPVEVLGFSDTLPVGTRVRRKGELEEKRKKIKDPVNELKKRYSKNGDVLKLIIKANTKGTLESVIANLPPQITILKAEIGDISISDVEYAAATKAAIIGFTVTASKSAQRQAQEEKVIVRTYQIIYKLIEEIEDVIAELTHEPVTIVTGRAKVLDRFEIDNLSVAGVRVEQGKLRKGDSVKVEKNSHVSKGKIVSIRQQKIEVKEAKQGEKYGIGVSHDLDFSKGDVIISYNIK